MEKRKLIDARGLYKKLFTCSDGSICPDTDCDNFPITLTVKSIKKAIIGEQTITEQEIIKPYLDKIRAEIEPKCDRINSLASVLPYAPHREIQELLCEIMDLCKAESEE